MSKKKAKAKAAAKIMGPWYVCMKMVASITRKICRWCALLGATGVIVVGCINIEESIHKWCGDTNLPHVQGCVGPLLNWLYSDHGVDDVNTGYRQVFTLRPDRFVDLWTPLILGLLVQFRAASTHIGILCKNWFRVMCSNIVIALFGAFGYAGNFGIICGFILSFVASLACILAIVSPSSECTMKLPLPCAGRRR